MRKAFNFFNSYWQTANELSDKDRLAFYDALLHYQFTGDKSKLEILTGMAKFAFISQAHSIESQVKGYIDKCKDLKINAFVMSTYTPTLPPAIGATEPPAIQVQGKGKGEDKGKVNIPPISDFISYALEKKPNVDKKAVELKYLSWTENGWKDGNNKPITNWKTKLLNTLPYISENLTTKHKMVF